MDLVVSPNIVGFNTQSGSHAQILTPGQLIDALVLKLIDATTVRLSVAGTVVDVKTQVPLEPGSAVRLAVRGHGNETRLVIVGQGGEAPASASSPSARAETPVTQITTSQGGATQAAAAGVNTGNASAPATLVNVQDGPSIAPQGTPPSTSQITSPPTNQITLPSVVTETDPTIALAGATRLAAARQSGLAPVFAEAEQAVQAEGVPPAVRQAATQLLALRSPLDAGNISAETVQKAVANSGLFLEARLGAQVSGLASAADVAVATSADIKAVLFTLREALKNWIDAPQVQGQAQADPAVVKSDEMVILAKSLAAEAKVPPPPYRNAPTQGQQPAAAAVPADAPPKLLGHALLEETTGAIARTTLMQAASLPGAPSATAEHADAGGKHWNLEIPFAMPQGTAIAHFEISRDDHKAAAAERKPPGWRVNFSLDVEPMGPVHAQVALTGHRAAVRLWAERSPTAAALRGSVSELTAAFRQAALEPAEVVVRDGAPPRPLKPGAGRFVDRAS